MALEDNDPQEGEPLIQPFMRSGKRLRPNPSLQEIRNQTLANYKRMPASMTALNPVPVYPVTISTTLRTMADQLDRERVMHEREAAK